MTATTVRVCALDEIPSGSQTAESVRKILDVLRYRPLCGSGWPMPFSTKLLFAPLLVFLFVRKLLPSAPSAALATH